MKMWRCACGNECADELNFCSKCGLPKSTNSWYYVDNGVKYGPYSLEKMKKAIANKKVTATTSVWTEGFSDWCTAKDTALNQFLVSTVPPVDPSMTNDKWVWALATVPLLVNLILPQFGITDHTLSIIVFILNSLFIILDINYLKKQQINPGAWMFLGFLLVPIYLFVRAAKTNKKYAYGFVWCGLFVFSIFLSLQII